MEKEFFKELQQLLKKYDVEIYASMYEIVVFTIGKDKKCIFEKEMNLEDGSYPENINAESIDKILGLHPSTEAHALIGSLMRGLLSKTL